MKKILLTAALLAITVGTSFAGIKNTKHDLSSGSSASVKATNSDQICVFCHTPHNAVQSVPLWNRSAGRAAADFRLYTSSKSLTTVAGDAKLFEDSQSLFCMNCHDATLGELGSRVNKRAFTSDGAAINVAGASWATSSANLGNNLTNDHPVGFSYGTAVTQDLGGLNAASAVKTAFGEKTVFFNANNNTVTDSMECSSCHAVHDNTYTPFLRTTNSGSTLCLACHAK